LPGPPRRQRARRARPRARRPRPGLHRRRGPRLIALTSGAQRTATTPPRGAVTLPLEEEPMDLDALEMPPTRMLILGQARWRRPDGTTARVAGGGDGDGEGGGDQPPESQPITSQEEFDRMVSDGLKRERKTLPSAAELEELRKKAKAF